jgi:hypothetical protein
LVKEWKRSNEVLNNFWRIWETEYLNKLRERADFHKQKNSNKNYIPKIGEIVLMQDNQKPKQFWPLAKIVELIKSKDGLIRTANVKSKNKIFKRAIYLFI